MCAVSARTTLLMGLVCVTAGVAGAGLSNELAWVRFFDNLHWTVGTVVAAGLALLALRSAQAENVPPLRWIALGLSSYAVGQVIWDIQVFAGYFEFPSPSDWFYLWLGPCIAVGLSRAAFRLGEHQRRRALLLDASMLTIAALTLTLVLYIPHRGAMTPAQLAVLTLYPVTLFAAAGFGLMTMAVFALRLSWRYALFLLSLTLTGGCWMQWNLLVLNGDSTDGLWFNGLFSYAVLGLGATTGCWKLEKAENPRWERLCEGFLRQLPLWAVVWASVAVIAAHVFRNIPEEVVVGGMVAVILLASVRQNALLAEYDLLRKTTQELEESRNRLQKSEARLQAILEFSPALIFLKDIDGRYLHVNRRFEQVFHCDNESVVGKTDAELFPEPQAGAFRSNDLLVLQAGMPLEFEELARHDDGVHTGIVCKFPLRDAGGNIYAIGGIVTDITERKKAEQDLRIAATAFETQEGIIITDKHHTILRVNRAFTRITGYPADEVIGTKPSLLNSARHEEDFYRKLHFSLQQKGYWRGEIWERHKRGHIYPKWLTITAVKDAQGETTHYVASFSDITKRKADEEKIRTLAFYDTLTDLPNRRLISERLAHAIAVSACIERYGALLYLDLDNFKALNDIQGHSVGDRLLAETGRRLLACIGEADTVSRLGGDEFVVLLENLASDEESAILEAQRVVDKIFAAFELPFILNESDYCCSACIGVALFSGGDSPYEVVLSRADTALYEAKKSGKKTCRFFDPTMQEALEKRANLEAALRQAIANKQFKLFYQIQVDQRQCPIGAEALLRWRHPQQGLISPEEFIPVAEATGMILDIGRWALETTCAQIKAWESHVYMRNLKVSVNVSIKQFYQQGFVDEVRDIVMRYAIDPAKLKLELTESVILEDAEAAIVKMTQLKNFGIRLSMDDFGTGYSSLSCIKRLPFDQVKIDKSFVTGVIEDANDRFIVSTVVGMGRLLGISVIAEGVENREQFELLKEFGCEFFQGYWFGKAESAEAFRQRCAQWPIAAEEEGRLPDSAPPEIVEAELCREK
ncbi:MAG: putative bifunctional diguanylate cyclase/phosphodiesterase [Gammaproteobacteria bacterium]